MDIKINTVDTAQAHTLNEQTIFENYYKLFFKVDAAKSIRTFSSVYPQLFSFRRPTFVPTDHPAGSRHCCYCVSNCKHALFCCWPWKLFCDDCIWYLDWMHGEMLFFINLGKYRFSCCSVKSRCG